MANKTIQKAVRLTPKLWAEIEASIEREGLPDFSAFAHMAIRSQLDKFDEMRALKGADLHFMLKKWQEMVEVAGKADKKS